jgi:hypothetical protein
MFLALPILFAGALFPAAIADPEEAAEARVRDGADLSQRLSAGPVVVRARVIEDFGKATLEVEHVYRSPGELPEKIRLAYRGDNIARRPGDTAFEPVAGETAVFVLERWTDYYGELGDADLYRPAEDYRSRIPLPEEGRQALLQAVDELVRYEDSDRRAQSEAELRRWLDGRNPWLIDAALSHVALYGPPGPRWTRGLVEYVQASNPQRRKLAVRALGLGLSRGRLAGEETGNRELCRRALVQAARTDDDPDVRRAAVRALGRSGLQGLKPLLEVIAERDENQEVRYEAETLLLRAREEASESAR